MSDARRSSILRIDDEKKRDQLRVLARWLSIVPLILVLLYGCATLALVGMPTVVADTRSQLQADYSPWPFMVFQPLSPEILEEIRRDQARYPETFGEATAIVVMPGELWPTQSLPGGGQTPTALPIASHTPTSTTLPIASHTPSSTATWLPTLTLPPTPTTTPSSTPASPATLPPAPTPTRPPDNPTQAATEAGEEVTICHKTGQEQVTKKVEPNAVQGHLDHGDYLGPCN